MGKAVDLPDPLDHGSLPTDAAAEDFLSQLAGAQIDQLLHEAPPKIEGPRAVRVAPVPAAKPQAPKPVDIQAAGVERESLVSVLDRAAEVKDDLPIALRPLKWLNAPFAKLSAQSRATLGRLAILLLLNATAVLLFVLIFGRR